MTRCAIFLTLVVALLSGCSFLYDLGTTQCRVTSDCRALGSSFSGLVCDEGLCVQPDKPPPDEPPPDAGTDADTPDPVGCTSHKECIDDNFGTPHLCRSGECISLYSPECPIVLQPKNLEVPEPIVIGAYSAINETDKDTSPITRSYKLALDEFTNRVGGLPGGPDGSRRKLVAVVCEGAALADAPLENSLAHLIDTVGVPAIVASLFPNDLREAFDARAKQDNIFFISPLTADSSLTSNNNDGLLWFMLGAYRDLAATFVPLVQRAEAYQRSSIDESTPTRVALVQGSLTPAQDVGQVLLSHAEHSLVFNGKPASENGSNFKNFQLTSDFEDDEAEATAVIGDLKEFRPHVIVVTAGTEFTRKVMPVLESTWDEVDDGQERPFYVLGPLLAVDGNLVTIEPSVLDRVAGVNFETAEDRTLFTMYKNNYEAAHPGDPFYEAENFYDAFYYMVYAIAAAGNPAQLRGENIAAGMARIVSPTGMSMPVGPSTISDILATLAVPNARINLKGTLGPSNFDLGNGSRTAKGSVWCINPQPSFMYDVLRLNESSQELEGTFPCFGGF